MKRLLLTTGVALIGITPAMAAPIEFSGRADARAGYGSNPFLQPGVDRGAGIVGFDISPTLRRRSATGVTTLTGVYSREQYLNNLGHPESIAVRLQQAEQLTPKLSMNLGASYSSSTNALGSTGLAIPTATIPVSGVGDTTGLGSTSNLGNITGAGNSIGIGNVVGVGSALNPLVADPLTIGLRTRTYQGDAAFGWRPNSVDSASLNAGYAHGISNPRAGIGSYDYYNVGVGYTHAIDARTQVGGRLGYTFTEADGFPSVSSYEPSFVVIHQFSEIWAFNGNIGVSIRRVPSLRQTSTGLGFNLSLCGTYPQTSVCVSGARQTSASGFGGARINTSLDVSISHQLSAQDTARVSVSYVDSKAIGITGPTATTRFFNFSQQFTQAYAGLDHKIGLRLVVGADGRFQTRTQDLTSNARALSVTARVGYLFGRIS